MPFDLKTIAKKKYNDFNVGDFIRKYTNNGNRYGVILEKTEVTAYIRRGNNMVYDNFFFVEYYTPRHGFRARKWWDSRATELIPILEVNHEFELKSILGNEIVEKAKKLPTDEMVFYLIREITRRFENKTMHIGMVIFCYRCVIAINDIQKENERTGAYL